MKKNTNQEQQSKWIKIIIISIILIILAIIFFSRASFRRWLKDLKSDYTGGLNRTVTVYDYNGNPIKSFTGKFDVEYKSDGSVKFDNDDKRVIITGGIIINETE